VVNPFPPLFPPAFKFRVYSYVFFYLLFDTLIVLFICSYSFLFLFSCPFPFFFLLLLSPSLISPLRAALQPTLAYLALADAYGQSRRLLPCRCLMFFLSFRRLICFTRKTFYADDVFEGLVVVLYFYTNFYLEVLTFVVLVFDLLFLIFLSISPFTFFGLV